MVACGVGGVGADEPDAELRVVASLGASPPPSAASTRRPAHERDGSEGLVHGVVLRVLSSGERKGGRPIRRFLGPRPGRAALRHSESPESTMTASALAGRCPRPWCSSVPVRRHGTARECASGAWPRWRARAPRRAGRRGRRARSPTDRARPPPARARCRAARPRHGGPRPGSRARSEPRGQRRNRQPRLETSDLSAGADRSAVGADRDVTDLAGGEAAARIGCPPASRPEPTPRPTFTKSTSSPAPPKVYSARTAAFASLATSTGIRSARPSSPSRSNPAHPRFGAVTTVPWSSTTPGVPTPTPSTGACESATSPRASWTTVSTRTSAAGSALVRRTTMSPSRVSTAPMNRSLPERSTPTMRWPVRSRSTRIAG